MTGLAGVPNLAVNIVSGLLSGALGAWILEGWYKPRRDRRRAARVLLREINLNRFVLERALPSVRHEARHVEMPVDFILSTRGADTVGILLSELPPEISGRVIEVYARYSHLLKIMESYHRLSEEHSALNEASPRVPELEASRTLAARTFAESITRTLEFTQGLMKQLGRYASDKQWKSHLKKAGAVE